MSEVHVTKKDLQEAKAPDAMLVGATSFFDWLVERRVVVGIFIAALLVVVGGIQFARASSAKAEAEVGAKLSVAIAMNDRPVVEKKDATETVVDEKSFPSAEAKRAAIQAALADVSKDAAKGPASLAADLASAPLQLQAGKPDEAIASLTRYTASTDPLLVKPFALESLGYAYEQKGDLANAAAAFDRLTAAGAPARALFHKARLAEKAGKKDEARKLYEQVSKDYASDIISNEARSRLDLMNLPAAGTGTLVEPPPAPVEPEKAGKKKGAKPVVKAPAPAKAPVKKKGK